MDTFYAGQHEEQYRGVFLKYQVAQPCWSREPETRPDMAEVKEILLAKFGEIIDINA